MIVRRRGDPVIVIGAHRSGTSLLTRVLDLMGVFMGSDIDANHESHFFQGHNMWLMSQCGGRWDHPTAIEDVMSDSKNRRLVAEYLRKRVGSPVFLRYLGMRGALEVFARRGMWGWKDPRNTFTLPVWRDVFPDARVVHVTRHGVDVAESLRRRQERYLRSSVRNFSRWGTMLTIVGKRGGFYQTPRCATRRGAFSLWIEYMTEAESEVERMGDRGMSLAYEELLLQPRESVSRLGKCLGLEVTESVVSQVAELMDGSRAYAFRRESSLRDFAGDVETRLRQFGYTQEGRIKAASAGSLERSD